MGSLPASAPTLPVVDITPFTTPNSSLAARKTVAKQFLASGHSNGFVGIRGHGFPASELAEAFALNKALFDLPLEQKLLALHPKGFKPHRGYSAPGNEKAFSKEDLEDGEEEAKKALQATVDLKESYEVGDDHNTYDTNIWLPPDVLPSFRPQSTALFNRLRDLSYVVLDALMLSLDFSEDEAREIKSWHGPPAGQLRFLHYLPVQVDDLRTGDKARLPAHTDWNSITISFQDSVGGLEYQDRASDSFINATPEPGLLYLSIGNMFERISNGLYPPGMHRVVLPSSPSNSADSQSNKTEGMKYAPDRYSIIFFLPVGEQAVVAPPASRVQADGEARFEPVKFLDYTEQKAKWHYEQYGKEGESSGLE